MSNTQEFLASVLLELASVAAQGVAYESWSDDFARKEVREVWEDQAASLRRTRDRKVTVAELHNVPVSELRRLGFNAWDAELTVIPLWAYHYIADGERLTCIDNTTSVKGTDSIDLDVRYGCIAYGFPTPSQNNT